MRNRIRHWSIRNKLLLSHTMILLVNAILVAITLKVYNKRYHIEELLSRTETMRVKSQQLHSVRQEFLLTERRNPAFYRNGISPALLRHAGLIREIDAELAWVNRSPVNKGNGVTTPLLEFTRSIHLQEKLFQQMADSLRQLGYGDKGLTGALQSQYETLKADRLLPPSDLEPLQQAVLAYREEKKTSSLIQFDSLAKAVRQRYANSPSTLAVLDQFQSGFNRLVQLERKIGYDPFGGFSNALTQQSDRNDAIIQMAMDALRLVYKQELKKLNLAFLGLMAVCILTGVVLSFWVAETMTKPLRLLARTMQQWAGGKFAGNMKMGLLPLYRKDEIGQVAFHFNQALQTIRLQTDQVAEKTAHLESINQQLVSNEVMLRKMNAQKDRFLSIISHDMRSPLSSIIGFLDFYKDNKQGFTEEEIKMVSQSLNTHIKKVMEMLDGLLLWSRSQNGDMQTNLQPIDLAAVIKETLLLLAENARQKKISVHTSLFSQLVWADANMTSFVIRNVLSNALKYTPSGGKIEIEIKRNRKNVYVTIKDSGVGISAENMKQLFQDTVTLTTFGTDNEKGIGLGLVLCRDFMHQQNGTIEIESIPDLGTTVNLVFPRLGGTQ
ncbi:MAG: sensor histidine kinase [Sphingobacteriia bacterium]|nr:MAG: sensor histidine kinase [Sphingobacteriia bacterium]